MNASEILNNTDPEELRNILHRLRQNFDRSQFPSMTVIINQSPSQYPPIPGDVVYRGGHDPHCIVITDDNGFIVTDVDLEFIRDTSYILGSQLSTGTVAGTSSTGVQITGLIIGEWYAVEGSGGPFHQHTSIPPFDGDYYIFELSLDGVTFSGEIGYSNTDALMHLDLPSFAAFAEAVDANHGRVYFQASTTSVWFRTVDGVWADNSGSLDYKLLFSSAGDKRITLNDVEYTKAKLAAAIHSATEKTTLNADDEDGIWDSLTDQLRKVTWATRVAVLTAIFDSLYASIDHKSEVLMQDGVTAPPVPVENEAQDDWLYQD